MRYGLLGESLPYSFSPRIHGLLGNKDYRLIELKPDEIPSFMEKTEFDGINVTIPYKKAVIPYLSEISERAGRIGSVNTIIKRPDGKLYGDNTDYMGLSYLIRSSDVEIKGKHVLILGSGGTSLTARTVCEDMGAESIGIVSRTGKLNYDNVSERKDTAVIINTTPVGTYPKNGKAPIDISVFPRLEAVVDVIYNPRLTALDLDAAERGIKAVSGLRMLVAQAKYSHDLFFGTESGDSAIEEIYKTLTKELLNITLIGMPGCGKSSVGEKLAALCEKSFADTDSLVERKAAMTIPEIFEKCGEAHFRDLESEACEELGKERSLVIATGGGTVLRPENMRALKQNGLVVFIQRSLDELSMDARPLSKDRETLEKLYKERIDLYRGYADVIVENEDTEEDAARKIREKVYEAIDDQRS